MYIKFLPSQYVLRYNQGKLVSEGVGLSFFYLDRFTSVCAVPIPNNDADFIFEVATQDFQNVTVQGQLTYRITDYKCTAGAMDFTVNLKTKQYNNDPMRKLSKRIVNIAEVLVK
ncbi:MAG: SPFH domain-containing protein, partial [Oscillospiraceae bacterium]|nr:SPFH domain-containing protein [Oscillospiraceae bacterium]